MRLRDATDPKWSNHPDITDAMRTHTFDFPTRLIEDETGGHSISMLIPCDVEKDVVIAKIAYQVTDALGALKK